MKHGVSLFFFFFLTPLFSFLCRGRGCEDELAAGRGLWAVDFLCCCGDRGGLPVPTRSEGVLAPGWALATPLGVVVPGPRSIECIWECECGYRVHFFVASTCGAKVVEYSFACMRVGEPMLVYMCACRLRLCVRSGP